MADGADINFTVTSGQTASLASGIMSATNGSLLTKLGDGVLNLAGNNTGWGGNISITKGAVNFTQNTAADTYISGTTTVASGTTLQFNAISSSLDLGTIVGGGAISLNGNSTTFNLAGDYNSFTGTMTLNGTAEAYYNLASAADSFGGSIVLGSGSNLIYDIDYSGSNTVSYLSGSGSLEKQGVGTLILTTNELSGWSGDLNIQEGSVQYNALSSANHYIGGMTNIATGASLLFNVAYLSAEGYSQQLNLDKFTGAGAITKTGVGAMKISGGSSGSFTGSLDITSGVLAIVSGTDTSHLGSLAMADGTTLSTRNNSSIGTVSLGNLTLNGNVNLMLDVDLENGVADKINASSVSGTGSFYIPEDGLTIVTDTLLSSQSVVITDTAALYDAITLSPILNPVFGPINEYAVSYANGVLSFVREEEIYNPSILISPVAAFSMGTVNQWNVFDAVMLYMDTYKFNHLCFGEECRKHHNLRGRASGSKPEDRGAFDVASLWVVPQYTNEDLNMSEIYPVKSKSFNLIAGIDSKPVDLTVNTQAIFSLYAGYLWGEQKFDSTDKVEQEGALAGIASYFYYDDWYAAAAANIGYMRGTGKTAGAGEDKFNSFMAGAVGKIAYNYKFENYPVVLQPNYEMAYTYTDLFSYTNGDGVRIHTKPLHSLQIKPGLKIAVPMEKWAPYIEVKYAWNISNRPKFLVEDVYLPPSSMDSYWEYSVGLQFAVDKAVSGFVSSNMRTGGRDGFSLNAGLKIAF